MNASGVTSSAGNSAVYSRSMIQKHFTWFWSDAWGGYSLYFTPPIIARATWPGGVVWPRATLRAAQPKGSIPVEE